MGVLSVAPNGGTGYIVSTGNVTDPSIFNNAMSSYGALTTYGTKNGYSGYISDQSLTNIMFDGSGNGGIYRESWGRWACWAGWSDNCTGYQGSSTVNWVRSNMNGTGRTTSGLYVAAACYAVSYQGWSDVRLKENIETISNPLTKLLALRGVYYTWKSDANQIQQIGLIAQEVESIVPEVVTYDDDQDAYTINGDGLMGLLVETIKEINTKLDNINQRLSILKSV